jgi:hypothetical protein
MPLLKGLKDCWAVKMHEVQMNDSRQCLLSLFTSSLDGFIPGMQGSTLANYCELKEFKKDKDGK